jgi:hypothetical protein
MSAKKRSVPRAIAGAVVSVLLLCAAAFLLLNQQFVKDQISVWAYTPDTAVQSVEKRIDFTPKGQFYFYATQPAVEDADAFNAHCERQEVGNPILGCYNSGRIYVYNVTNAELDGIEEVTAAHETLHAAWERMGAEEQKRIGALLDDAYQKLQGDTDLTARMQYYQRTEPGQFENELHSILGTEQASLSPALEEYYKHYFNDRQKIVGLHEKYNSVFVGLRAQADGLYKTLTSLRESIDTRTAQYNADISQLSKDIEAFNTRANGGDFTSLSKFNAERARLVARSNQIEADRTSIGTDIDTYNAKYAQYQQVSSQIETLNKSIDSIKDLQPAPSV